MKHCRNGHPRNYTVIKGGKKCCQLCSKEETLKRKYNITLDDYNTLMTKYNNSCAICGSTEKLCVDHCHSSGNVRGILCHHCNTGLGMFKDNDQALAAAIRYLRISNYVNQTR